MEWYLDKKHEEPAYHCGRLFQVLSFAQARALGAMNASVQRKYFGAVMASPSSYAGRLIALCEKAHLPGLDKKVQRFLRFEIALIHSALRHEYPARMTPRDTTFFALGFYHELGYLQQHLTAKYCYETQGGDFVMSGEEQMVANILYDLGLDYVYEAMLKMPSGLRWERRYPDFAVFGLPMGGPIFLEVLGMAGNMNYDAEWEIKKSDYSVAGISPLEEGIGRRGAWISIMPQTMDEVDVHELIRSKLKVTKIQRDKERAAIR